ncbi:hypothetical protein JCM10207_000885 [Rhodosporidiobolus poonsookiae]
MNSFFTLRMAKADGRIEEGQIGLYEDGGKRRTFEDVKREVESSTGGLPVVFFRRHSRLFPSSWSTVRPGDIIHAELESLPVSPPLSPSSSSFDLHRHAALLSLMSAERSSHETSRDGLSGMVAAHAAHVPLHIPSSVSSPTSLYPSRVPSSRSSSLSPSSSPTTSRRTSVVDPSPAYTQHSAHASPSLSGPAYPRNPLTDIEKRVRESRSRQFAGAREPSPARKAEHVRFSSLAASFDDTLPHAPQPQPQRAEYSPSSAPRSAPGSSRSSEDGTAVHGSGRGGSRGLEEAFASVELEDRLENRGRRSKTCDDIRRAYVDSSPSPSRAPSPARPVLPPIPSHILDLAASNNRPSSPHPFSSAPASRQPSRPSLRSPTGSDEVAVQAKGTLASGAPRRTASSTALHQPTMPRMPSRSTQNPWIAL